MVSVRVRVRGETTAPSGLYSKLCHAFLGFIFCDLTNIKVRVRVRVMVSVRVRVSFRVSTILIKAG